jgi:SAM-dependent methyltransferase
MQNCPHPAEGAELLFPASDYITGETFQVVRCSRCAQVVTLPVPLDIGRYYPAGYYGDKESRRFPSPVEWLQQRLYARRVRFVLRQAHGRKGSTLDVGCGRGLLLRAFQQNGFDVTGTEFSDDACRYAREVLKIPVRVGLLETLRFPDDNFDVVIMWHVLEHLSDPRSTLAEIARILRPGGIFLVGVPNFGSPEARLTRAGWFHLDVPRHLSHHTPASLNAALATAGLRPVRMSFFAPEYDCFSFVQSLLNWLGVRHNLLYNLLRGRRAKVFVGEKSSRSLIATVLLAPLLGLISLPATLLLGASGLGSALTLAALNEKPPQGKLP